MADPAGVGFELAGGEGRYRIDGTASYANARRLLEAGRGRFGAERRIEISLGGLTAIDSAGLAVLVTWLAEARAAGGELVYRDLPAALAATARVAGVEALLRAA